MKSRFKFVALFYSCSIDSQCFFQSLCMTLPQPVGRLLLHRHNFRCDTYKRLHQPLRYMCHTGIIKSLSIYTHMRWQGVYSIQDVTYENKPNTHNVIMFANMVKMTKIIRTLQIRERQNSQFECVDCGNCYLRKRVEQQLTEDVLSWLRVEHVKCV